MRSLKALGLWMVVLILNYLAPAVLRRYSFDPDKIADETVGFFFPGPVTSSDVQVAMFWFLTAALVLFLAWPYRHLQIDKGLLSTFKWHRKAENWLHPTLSIEQHTNEDIRRERDNRRAIHRELINKHEILHRQLQGAFWNETKTAEDKIELPDNFISTVSYEISELWERKRKIEPEIEIYENEVLSDLYSKLRAGKLTAKGFAVPHSHGRPEIEIPAAEWRFLKLTNDMDQASGEGISYTQLLIKIA
jgi:hypothetical protein